MNHEGTIGIDTHYTPTEMLKLEVVKAIIHIGFQPVQGLMTRPDNRFYIALSQLPLLLHYLPGMSNCTEWYQLEDYLTVDGVVTAVLNENFIVDVILADACSFFKGVESKLEGDPTPLIDSVVMMYVHTEFKKAFKVMSCNTPLR